MWRGSACPPAKCYPHAHGIAPPPYTHPVTILPHWPPLLSQHAATTVAFPSPARECAMLPSAVHSWPAGSLALPSASRSSPDAAIHLAFRRQRLAVVVCKRSAQVGVRMALLNIVSRRTGCEELDPFRLYRRPASHRYTTVGSIIYFPHADANAYLRA